MKNDKKEIGKLGENTAAKFLKKNKYKLIGRNLHFAHNELDIVALNKKQRIISFVEVKARSVGEDLYSKFGTPASAVDQKKRSRTIKAAIDFLSQNTKYQAFQPRFDVIEIYLDKDTLDVLKINFIENAFGV